MADRDPWEAPPPPPAKRDPWEAPPEPADTLTDVGKTAVSEAAKAPLRPLGFIGDINQMTGDIGEWIARKVGVNPQIFEEAKRLEAEHKLPGSRGAPTTEDLARGVEKIAGQELFHRPETRAGEYAGAIAGAATDPLSLASGPFSVPRMLGRLGAGGLSGAAGKLGSDVAGPVGGLIGAAGTSLGTSRIAGHLERQATRAANAATQPTEPQIRDAARQGYQTAREMNVEIPRGEAIDLGAQIREHLVREYGHRPFNEPKTFAALRLLEDPANIRPLEEGALENMSDQAFARRQATVDRNLERRIGIAGPSSSSELLSIRDTLNNIRRDNPGTSEGLAAGRALDRIDTFLEDVPGLNAVTRRARGNYRVAERASDLQEAIDKAARDAQAGGGSMANNLRRRINRIIDDDTKPKRPEEEAALREIVGSGGFPQQLAKLGPNHWLWGLWAALHGNILHGAALVAPGSIGRWWDNAQTRRMVEEARDNILRSAPAGGGPALPLPPRYPAGTVPAAAARARDALAPTTDDDSLAPR